MFSGGKDCVAALAALNEASRIEPVRLVTTYNEDVERIALHGTPLDLLRGQADAIGLPLTRIGLPANCDNETYITRVAHGLAPLREAGISAIAFGDIHLADIREFRERQFQESGFRIEFPLWGRNTAELARTSIERGVEAVVCCVDLEVLPEAMLGRSWNREFIDELPETVDPCGENGEFHTFVVSAPEMRRRIDVRTGTRHVSHGRFCMLDLHPA
ncbi:MAG: diphthine--ammonia ligase [Wenzhouxiangellaceae bacterium]|nr:diphthine--ammonia ligase [Wenzhouxiangellaceae bacterium]